MDDYKNKKLSFASKNIYNHLQAKQLTFADFMRECAFWAIKDGFDELRPYPLPSKPNTQAFMDFELLSPERKAKVDPGFFRINYEIMDYYRQAFYICQRNQANLDWLKEIKSYLSPEDTIMISKVDNRILEFNAFFDDNPVAVQKIKNTFQAKEVKPRKKPYQTFGEVINEEES
jgi:hypothetical protein